MNKTHNINPVISEICPKLCVGISMQMSVTKNTTQQLWSSFMPRRNEIKNQVGPDLFSLQVYPDKYFEEFNPEKVFTKWALVEVSHVQEFSPGMESFILIGGLYAKFEQKGTDLSIFEYIYNDWINNSDYKLDDRPHFEVLGKNYKSGSKDSEEDIYVPVISSTY